MRNKKLRETCRELRSRLDRQAPEPAKTTANAAALNCLPPKEVAVQLNADKENKSEKERIIAEYLLMLAKANAPALIGGEGYSPALPPRRPRNLREAKKLADQYLK